MKTFWRALWEGLASISSFGAYPPVRLPTKTDAEAIASDWTAVGDDLRRAIDTYESTLERKASG